MNISSHAASNGSQTKPKSSHAYLLFFTNQGKVYWQKVYDLPQLNRESRGRAIVNLLRLGEGEHIADCRAVRDFDLPGHFLMMSR